MARLDRRISQGDIFWFDPPSAAGSVIQGRRPVVVVQNNLFNHGGIKTTLVCALTTSSARASVPGNVKLSAGEANLPRQSVVNVTQWITVDKSFLVSKIGSLSPARMNEIIDGIR